MPFKLISPRAKRSKYYRIRGTYLGVYVDRSTKTTNRALAVRYLQKWQEDTEENYVTARDAPTFENAARAYITAGGEAQYLAPLIEHFGSRSLARIDQTAIDQAAAQLFPSATNGTRNRQVYTPTIAVIRRAGIGTVIRRPKGAQGTKRTHFLKKSEAFALLEEAMAIGQTFGVMCIFLLYTGARISEALALEWDDVDIEGSRAWFRTTKNGMPRMVHLPPTLVREMKTLRADEPRVFPYYRGGPLVARLRKAATRAKVTIPPRVAFHIFRHTYGAWLRRYAGLDTSGLVATGAWRSRQAAAIYEHVDVTKEAQKADMLPAFEFLRSDPAPAPDTP